MKILIVDFAASEGGAMTILNQYYKQAKKDRNNSYTFLLSGNYVKETKNISIKILNKEKRWLHRLIFDHFTGKKLVSKLKPDRIISLQNTIIRGAKTSQTVYVHQSIPFQKLKNFSLFKKEERKLAIIQYFVGHEIKASIKKANMIIVQTKWMRNAIIEQCKIPKSHIIVEPPTVIVSTYRNGKRKDGNHFFYPTSDAIYKNNKVIYEAARILEDEGYDDFVIELTIDGKSTKHIKKIGRISHKEVMKKYQKTVLLFPSYIETFGLPLLEARKSRAPIIAADTVFAREILKGYSDFQLFSAESAIELASIMRGML